MFLKWDLRKENVTTTCQRQRRTKKGGETARERKRSGKEIWAETEGDAVGRVGRQKETGGRRERTEADGRMTDRMSDGRQEQV